MTSIFQERIANAPNIGKTLKIVFDEGPIFLDFSKDNPTASNEDIDADCTITTTFETFTNLIQGKLNPTMALMSGKVKVKGDMSVALKLQSLLGK